MRGPELRASMEQLQQPRAATEGIFSRSEKMLEAGSEYFNALEYVSANVRSKEKYMTTIDFLFCEIFDGYKSMCFDYYQNKGPSMKMVFETLAKKAELDSSDLINQFDTVLVSILEEAKQWQQERNPQDWKAFKTRTKNLLAGF